MKRPVASPPLHNSPPGAARPLAPAGVGGGAWGSAGPLRTPGGPHCLYSVTRATRARTARAGRAAPAGVGDKGGTGFSVRCDRSPAGHTTLHFGVTVLGFLGPRPGFWGPHPGAVGPPRSVSVREARVGGRDKGHSRP